MPDDVSHQDIALGKPQHPGHAVQRHSEVAQQARGPVLERGPVGERLRDGEMGRDRALRAVSVGDVLDGADDSPRPPVGFLDDGLAGSNMTHHPAGAHDPIFERPNPAGSLGLDLSLDTLPVMGMHLLEHVIRGGRDPSRFEAEDAVEVVRPQQPARVEVPIPAAGLRHLLTAFEQRLERRLGRPLAGRVQDRRHERCRTSVRVPRLRNQQLAVLTVFGPEQALPAIRSTRVHCSVRSVSHLLLS